jgi:hypothetical protein
MESQGDRVGAEVWVLLVLDMLALIFVVWLVKVLADDGFFVELWREWFQT